jgi:hypothetical protein
LSGCAQTGSNAITTCKQQGVILLIFLKLFQEALNLYDIDKDMIGGVTQDNAANCGTCIKALVEDGFDRGIFYGCYLHILNLACQAAIKVYDPDKKSKPVRRTVLTNLDDKSESEESLLLSTRKFDYRPEDEINLST